MTGLFLQKDWYGATHTGFARMSKATFTSGIQSTSQACAAKQLLFLTRRAGSFVPLGRVFVEGHMD